MARRSTGRRTDYTWQGGALGSSLSSGGAFISSVFTAGTAATLMRSRGEVVASIDGITDGDKAIVGVGLIVVTEEQLAAGATSVPDPITDFDAEWVWHGFLLLMSQAIVATTDDTHNARLSIDSKAMRRMKQTMSLVFVATNVASAGTPNVDVLFGCRSLVGA